MKICVVGSGYVGLVTGACLADFGTHVVCVDKDASKIERLNRGEIPIYEPGLKEIVDKNRAEGRLDFSTDVNASIQEAVAVFIAVGTPPAEDGSANLEFVRQVAQSIGENLNGFKIIVTKSTVPIGTGRMIEGIVSEASGSKDFAVVSNPEFLREGSAIDDFLHPDRVVIGTRDPRAADLMLDIYSPLRVADVQFVVTNVESAEMIKYASNAFLATKISFINETAELCEAVGADVEVVAKGMGLDNRIGPRFLHPGPGFGGSCFPKDTQSIAHIAKQEGMTFEIVEAVLSVNERTKLRMVDKIQKVVGDLEGKRIGVLGLAFKPDTDDVRESPAIPIVENLLSRGATVHAFDPAAMETFQVEVEGMQHLDNLHYANDAYAVAEEADALVIVTEWNLFRKLEFPRLEKLMAKPVIIDLRNIYDQSQVQSAGFHYTSIGRPAEGSATPKLRAVSEAG